MAAAAASYATAQLDAVSYELVRREVDSLQGQGVSEQQACCTVVSRYSTQLGGCGVSGKQLQKRLADVSRATGRLRPYRWPQDAERKQQLLHGSMPGLLMTGSRQEKGFFPWPADAPALGAVPSPAVPLPAMPPQGPPADAEAASPVAAGAAAGASSEVPADSPGAAVAAEVRAAAEATGVPSPMAASPAQGCQPMPEAEGATDGVAMQLDFGLGLVEVQPAAAAVGPWGQERTMLPLNSSSGANSSAVSPAQLPKRHRKVAQACSPSRPAPVDAVVDPVQLLRSYTELQCRQWELEALRFVTQSEKEVARCLVAGAAMQLAVCHAQLQEAHRQLQHQQQTLQAQQRALLALQRTCQEEVTGLQGQLAAAADAAQYLHRMTLHRKM
ncbi:hypothetical protein ABPG75_008182 [Micractinium tetrahymenae]